MEHAGTAAIEGDVDREAVAVGDRCDDDSGGLREPLAPAVRHAVEKERRLAAREGLHVPAAGLVAALVLKPENALAVQRGDGIDETHRVIRHLTTRARLTVER